MSHRVLFLGCLIVTAGCHDTPLPSAAVCTLAENVEPRLPPTNAPPGDGSAPMAFAVNKLFVGSTDGNGRPDALAWAGYGFNLDHEIFTVDFSKHCLPNGTALPKLEFPDGECGRDNSVGKTLLPIVQSVNGKTDVQTAANRFIMLG